MEANDIALIGLQQKIYFTNNVAPACLQTDLPDERTDVKLIAIGWKSGSEFEEFSAADSKAETVNSRLELALIKLY